MTMIMKHCHTGCVSGTLASVRTCAAIVRIRPRGPTAGDEELDFEEFLQIFLSQLAKIKCAHSDTVTMTLPSSARALKSNRNGT